MKASQAIYKLQKIIESYDDFEILVNSFNDDSMLFCDLIVTEGPINTIYDNGEIISQEQEYGKYVIVPIFKNCSK